MSTNYMNKEKQGYNPIKKKRTNWNQSLKTKVSTTSKLTKVKKSLQYVLLLRKFNYAIDYKNVKLLQAFLTKYGKIRPRRKTRISVQHQRSIAKSIRKARAYGLIPFTLDVKV